MRKFDGEMVWRRRHYRVRRAEQPGTFFFSVLDNGVISSEFWRYALQLLSHLLCLLFQRLQLCNEKINMQNVKFIIL